MAGEEEAHRRPGCMLPWTPDRPSYTGHPERLAAFRAGEPVNLVASELPRWAREGVDVRSSLRRAVVSPDGAVSFEADDGRLWLAERGL